MVPMRSRRSDVVGSQLETREGNNSDLVMIHDTALHSLMNDKELPACST